MIYKIKEKPLHVLNRSDWRKTNSIENKSSKLCFQTLTNSLDVFKWQQWELCQTSMNEIGMLNFTSLLLIPWIKYFLKWRRSVLHVYLDFLCIVLFRYFVHFVLFNFYYLFCRSLLCFVKRKVQSSALQLP